MQPQDQDLLSWLIRYHSHVSGPSPMAQCQQAWKKEQKTTLQKKLVAVYHQELQEKDIRQSLLISYIQNVYVHPKRDVHTVA